MIDQPRLAGSPALRVAIADDDAAFRSALAALIDQQPGMTTVGQYASVEQALNGLRAAQASVLLLDVHMPREPGSEGVRRIRERFPGVAVLMLTAFSDESMVFESICNGAVGYMLKSSTSQRLVMAIVDAAEGGSPMSPEVARKVVALFQRTGHAAAEHATLAGQEVRLLSLLARGCTYQSAANEMHVSVNTVRNYVRAIYEKLHVHSKGAAVAKGFRQGLI